MWEERKGLPGSMHFPETRERLGGFCPLAVPPSLLSPVVPGSWVKPLGLSALKGPPTFPYPNL